MSVTRAVTVLPADPSQIAVARRFVRDTTGGALDVDVVADLQLIASELVSNTIEHGGTDEVTVVLELSDGAVSLMVTTGASAGELGPVDSWTIAQVDRRSGRGLGIVRELADAIALEDSDAGRRLVVTIDLAARG